MKHEFDCYCIKCQHEDVPQRTSKLVFAAVIAVLALALTFGQRAQAADIKTLRSESVECYKALGDEELGFVGKVTVGSAVELCAGTRDAANTVACFVRAFYHKNDGGLGLPLGMAVKLCRSL